MNEHEQAALRQLIKRHIGRNSVEATSRRLLATAMDEIENLQKEATRLRRQMAFTQEWYAVRFERLRDLGKQHGIWNEMACIIANGTANVSEPPSYAQLLNTALHRAKAAEKERDHWKANHANEVNRARILKERLDMPYERVDAYELIGELQAKLAAYEKKEQ
jgi:hypothetical protein